MMHKKNAFTLVELMVCIVIMSGIGLTVVKMMSNAQANAAIARCRGNIRQNAQIAARQLERDISSSRAVLDKSDNQRRYKMTLEPGTPGGPTVLKLVTHKADIDDEDDVKFFDENVDESLYETVTYDLSNGVLTRNGDKSRKIADYVKSIELATNSVGIETTYDGKIEFTITTCAKPDGQKNEIEHKEQVIVAIRQLQNKLKNDEVSTWKQNVSSTDY